MVNSAVDRGLHDSYCVVAHFHYVLSLSTIIATLVGLLYVLSGEVRKWLTNTRLTGFGIGMNGLGKLCVAVGSSCLNYSW